MPHLFAAGLMHRSGRAMFEASPGLTAPFIGEISKPGCAPLIDTTDTLITGRQPPGTARNVIELFNGRIDLSLVVDKEHAHVVQA